MIIVSPADKTTFRELQQLVTEHHYLHAPVDVRCSPIGYEVRLADGRLMGCLIFGRPEATRCYTGGFTYGSLAELRSGRVAFDRWEILNLARVWIDPQVQTGGYWCAPEYIPGFVDRRGVWRSTLVSTAIEMALGKIGYDYLCHYPPVWMDEPHELRAVLSYCDTRVHRGTIYQAAGFRLARTNERGIQTWWRPINGALTPGQRADIQRRSVISQRNQQLRGKRMQLSLFD